MKIALIFPYIVPKADALRPDLERFVETFNKFPPGTNVHVWFVPCNGITLWIDDKKFLIEHLNWYWNEGSPYNGDGCDIGCHIHAANWLPSEYDWMVCCSSQVHFHREGWLAKIVEAREKLGQSLYGAMGSFEQLRPHIRTCFFAIEPALLRGYPEVVNSRVKSLQFESQPNNFQGWLERQGMTGYMVAWDGIYGPNDYRKPANVFRRGDQSNCLVWDKHTAMYAAASPEDKEKWEKLANGVPPPF